MKTVVSAKAFSGEICTISSKSMAHRLLIASAASKEPTKLYIHDLNNDINATVDCLKAMGAKICQHENFLLVTPFLNALQNPTFDCGESGSTLRFLLPFSKVFCKSPIFKGSNRLSQRPILSLKKVMETNGCIFSNDSLPFSVKGKLKSGVFNIDGNISSQFITGLLLALPLLKEKSEIVITSPLESKSYVDMTIEVLTLFGILPQKTENGFILNGGDYYKTPHEIKVEGDWSNAAFWLSAGAIKGSVTVSGLNNLSSQGDSAVISVLKKFGAKITEKNDQITVFESNLKGIEINAQNIPDLVPVLAVLACKAKGTTTIKNAKRLRLKESDRLFAMCQCLSSLGANIKETTDGLIIKGGFPLKGGTVSSFNDHRIAMSMAVSSLLTDEKIIIDKSEAVNKSYPRFFEDFNKLGGFSHVL